MNVIQKSLALLGKEKRKLPLMLMFFFFMSVVDVLGIGLMGPYIAFVMDPEQQAVVAESLGRIVNMDIDVNSGMLFIGVTLMVFFVLRACLAIAANGYIIGFAERQRLRLKLHLLETYQSMSSQVSSERNTAEYIQAVHTLTGHFSGNVLFFMLKFVSEFIIFISLIGLLAFQSVGVVIVLVLLLGGGNFVWDRFSKGRLKFFGGAINQHSGEALAFLRESLDGYEEVRILGKTEAFHKRFADNSSVLAKLQKKAAVLNSVPRYLLELLILLFVLFICTFSYLFTDNFVDFLPVIGVFGLAAMRLMPSATLLAHAVVCIRHNSNTVSLLYEDYRQGLSVHSDFVDSNNSKSIAKFRLLEIDDLSFGHKGQRGYLFEHVNLTIKAGEAIGIVGPSGSGKSTLADLILGLIDPDKGTININSNPIGVCKKSWQSHLAVIPQKIFLIDASIAVNVSLEFDETKIDLLKLENALAMASIDDFVESLPLGVSTKVGENGTFLSGGQRQRLILARAFYHDRDFLVMDEATSALDSKTEAKIIAEMMSLKSKVTIIVIAHRLSTIEHCDHVFEIIDGKICKQR